MTVGQLDGAVCLVTGGSRGIGRACALALAAAGGKILIGYQARADAAQSVADEIAAAGGTAWIQQADVSQRVEADALVAAAVERGGRLDVLVNNAGITRDTLLLRMQDEAWREVLAADLDGAFFCLRAAAKVMLRQRSGRLINVVSVAGLGGNPGQANYSAAKAGLIGLTRTAAAELAGRQVTVNAVAPGWIETEMTAATPDAARQAVLGRVPLGRAGTPEDVAGAVGYLASPAAAYVTGTVLVVDGGLTMGG
jgi:3-oxoacyl-[acyl-carrier protein] reductase